MTEARDLPMMPWYPKDFYTATAHWALAERHAYRTLLDYQWMLGVLPTDPKQLSRLVGVSETEFTELWIIVSKKFELTEDGYRNARLESHRIKSLEVLKSRSEGARSTNAKRHGQRSVSDQSATRSSVAQRSHPNPNPNISSDIDIPAHIAERTLSDTVSENESPKPPDRKRESRGTRIPDDFVPDLPWALTQLPDLDAEQEAAKFCDYWRARPGKEALKIDWPATWRTWIRSAKDRGQYPRKPNGNGGTPEPPRFR